MQNYKRIKRSFDYLILVNQRLTNNLLYWHVKKTMLVGQGKICLICLLKTNS